MIANKYPLVQSNIGHANMQEMDTFSTLVEIYHWVMLLVNIIA